MWVGVKDIPLIGTIRVGHHKTPQGLESDDWSSNRTFTYMERSTMSNAFFQNFGSGIIATNSFFSQRMTYASMFYKPQDGENGAEYADGDYAWTGRISGLPIYQKDGRCLLHLAVSATYRHNRNGNATVSGTPEFFDFNGGDNGYGLVTAAGGVAGKATNVSNMNASVNGALAGNANPNGANAAALVSTGAVTSTAETVFGGEMLYIRGPFSVQAEYAALTFVDTQNAGGAGTGSTGNVTVTGGYVAVSYILTGENRTYDTRLGRLGNNYLETRTPFWLVRDGNGNFNYGLGAWEIEARFSHLDLNTHDINGGETDALNLGLVWHLNNNLRVTFDYLRQNRYDLPVGVNSGWLSGFGIRTQLQF
jgi:phosphate-selective porin OprO/OprP